MVDTSSDNLSGVDTCEGSATYSGPDAAPASVAAYRARDAHC